MNLLYYISNDKRQEGPFTKDELVEKKISRSTLVWREGFDKWLPVSNVKELSELWDNLSHSSQVLPPALPESTDNIDMQVVLANTERQESGQAIPLEEVNKKHGIPALISFFLPGVGQLIKGHIGKAFLIWILGFISFVMLVWSSVEANKYSPDYFILLMGLISFLGMIILFFWNVYDAYNAN